MSNGREAYENFKQTIIDEFNSLSIPGMSKISELYALAGSFVNLEYPLPSGGTMKLLDNNSMYLGKRYIPPSSRTPRYCNLLFL